MIKFILSNSFNNLQNNLQLIEQNNYNNLFWGIEANIPFLIYNSKINNNFIDNFASYEDIIETLNIYKEISQNLILFDCGNLLLDSFDYQNTLGEIIFNEYTNKINCYFEVADINFIDFLINKYPNIQIILHENYTIFHTEQEIKNILDKYSNNIKSINITILNLCENIDIQKIGILNLDSCYYCPQFPLCLKNEHKNILEYKSASIFNECFKKKNININNLIENIKNILNQTDIILFQTIPMSQDNNYIDIIKEIFKKEQEGVFIK